VTSATPVSGTGITGGGSGYAALLAHGGWVLYGMELGSVTLQINNQHTLGARGMSSVRYGTRLGDLKEKWFLCFPIKHPTHTQHWISWNCQQLGLPIPHLLQFQHHTCTCERFAIDEYGDHLHSCTQHAGATTGAHEHILTAMQQLFTQAGYATDRKNVPHSRGKKKADLHVKDFRLEGIRNVIST
jgi:hypothetical protein